MDEESRFLSLVHTLAPEFYDHAHAYQHGADNSDACWVPQPTNVKKIGTCVVPQFTGYVEMFHLDGVNADVMPLRVRLTSWRNTIFTSSSPVGPTAPPMFSAAAYPVWPAHSRPGQPSGRELSASTSTTGHVTTAPTHAGEPAPTVT